jgi:hypothetical protein
MARPASLNLLFVIHLLSLSFSAAAQSQAPILGTKSVNISSDSTQLKCTFNTRRERNWKAGAEPFLVDISTWRSDTEGGVYQAYSNESDAKAIFSFVGVGAEYVAVRKADRGLCQITVDQTTSYT